MTFSRLALAMAIAGSAAALVSAPAKATFVIQDPAITAPLLNFDDGCANCNTTTGHVAGFPSVLVTAKSIGNTDFSNGVATVSTVNGPGAPPLFTSLEFDLSNVSVFNRFSFQAQFDKKDTGDTTDITLQWFDQNGANGIVTYFNVDTNGLTPSLGIHSLDGETLSKIIISDSEGFKELKQFAFNGALAPPVPEPATWAMMVLGFAGVGFMAYRRRSVQHVRLV
jgi:hypothetical protein